MARGKKTGGRNFEPGNTFGKGTPPIPLEIRESKEFTRAKLIESMTKYTVMPLMDLTVLAKDQSLPAVDHIIIRIIINAIQKGDHTRLDFILDRLHGKVKQVVENIGNGPSRDVGRLDDMHKELVMLMLGQPQGLISGDT